MESIQQILTKENRNCNGNNHIYLYKIENYWFAYERSAFYLFSICCVDAVFKYSYPGENAVLISVLKSGYEKAGNPQLKVVERTENQMVLNCGIVCKGFEQWKEGLIPMFKDLYFKRIVRNYYHSLYNI